jgi:polysaccharide biosynthesis PFTS motif protein
MKKYLDLNNRYKSDHELVGYFQRFYNKEELSNRFFSKNELSDRLIQATFFHVLRKKELHLSNGNSSVNGIFLNKKNNTLNLSFNFLLENYLNYLKYFLYILSKSPFLLMKKQNIKNKVSILLDLPFDKISSSENYNRFKDYCNSNIITPLNKDTHLFIKSTINLNDDRFTQSKLPLLEAISVIPFSFQTLIIFLKNHMKYFFYFSFLCIKNNYYSLLFHDFAFLAVLDLLEDSNVLKSVIITNSSLYHQELGMRKLNKGKGRSEMIWYSANNKNLKFKGFENEFYDSTCYNLLRIGRSWVWSESEKNWLNSFNLDHEIKVAGPIIFEPLLKRDIIKSEHFNILIFDISPMSEKSFQNLLDVNKLYINYEVMKKFLEEIIEISNEIQNESGIKINLFLKHKRAYTSVLDKRYFDFVSNKKNNGDLLNVDLTNSVCEMVQNSSIVISSPFSSPCLIADYFKIPAVYFDPEDCLVKQELPNTISFLSTKEKLKNYILNIAESVS